jgi:hypothetical protein
LAAVDGRPVPEGGAAGDADGGPAWIYRHLGRPEGPVKLELRRPAGEAGADGRETRPPALRTALYLEGLPDVPEGPSTERPPDLMGSPVLEGRRVLTDLTVVRDTARF